MLYIRFKPSLSLALLLALVHALAIGSVLALPVPTSLNFVTIPLFFMSFVFYFRRTAWLAGANSIIALEIKEDGRGVAQTRRGEHLDCMVLPTSYVSASLTVLNVKVKEKRLARHVVILPDAVDGEDFRKLRVLLRWKLKTKLLAPR
ncbi:MAG TPA: protein YgfX [Burkholderiales bacterium]|nr:protein YgfX [Burkholderiales bacterium]